MQKCILKNSGKRHDRGGFTVLEVAVALIIIALICSTVLVVVKDEMAVLGESRLRMEAFETARENMENLLTASSVSEMDDYGTSEKNPDIQWETVVEPFTEELTGKMWIRAVCTATYPDANGQPQKIELTHWLTDVPANVMQKILEDQQKLRDMNEPNSLDANQPLEQLQNQNETTNPQGQMTSEQETQANQELEKAVQELLKQK
jgi:type II secretory pathway component PulJ